MSVADAIATHRDLVERYYALFNDDGDLLADPTEAETGLRKTVDAFNVVAAAPCSTIEEVREKVTYMLEGESGAHFTLLDDLLPDGEEIFDESGPFKLFLLSMLGNRRTA